MKKRSIFAVIAAAMSAVMIMLTPMQVMAAETNPVTSTEYISEVRIGVGKTMEEAENSLKGYTILKNGDNNADLNEKAGGGMGSQGERVVLLGYKTTTDRNDAVTDLAVMNMKGGYDIKEYEALMEKQMKEQIIPFVENFKVAIEEYRENYDSDIEANKQRAQYIHDALNKFIDDDTGKGLGDLLLNETKYEMGDEAYNKLSDEEKKEHADILTIIAQSNGKATLMMENLITRAADTEENTWLDRFAETTYDNMVDSADMAPSEAKSEIARLYDDDAAKILVMWDPLYEQLQRYDSSLKKLNDDKTEEFEKYKKIIDEFDPENATDEQITAFAEAKEKTEAMAAEQASALADVTLKEYLEGIDYSGGTMLDFFNRPVDEAGEDRTEIYPLVASLSDGQRAGLDFITLSDLIMIGATDNEGYSDSKLDKIESASIYSGVDRAIYEKGGVALTSEAERKKKSTLEAQSEDEKSLFSIWSYVMMGVTGAAVTAFTATAITKVVTSIQLPIYLQKYTKLNNIIQKNRSILNEYEIFRKNEGDKIKLMKDEIEKEKALSGKLDKYTDLLESRSSLCNKLMIGFGVAMIVLSLVTTYLSYRDMQEYYKVDFTPIPHYMVDEKDITAYNAKGEKIVIKNQSAYYKAVECNRTNSDEKYKDIGICADLNGDVGKQWLALYAVKNEAMAPIIADSLIAVINNTDLPAGYTTGIHMFGSDSAFNLNDSRYVWDGNASKVFVYFNVDDEAVSTSAGTNTGANNNTVTGSVYTGGYLFLSGGIGLLIGAGIVALIFVALKPKNKEEETE